MADYAQALLSPGWAMLVEAHLDLCGVCSLRLQEMEGPGRAPALIGSNVLPTTPPLLKGLGLTEDGTRWPASLRPIAIEAWVEAGAGVTSTRVQRASGLGEEVCLLKASCGASLPLAKGSGAESVLLLQGSFSDGSAMFGAGDLLELDLNPLVDPVVQAAYPCICLVVQDQQLDSLD